MRLFSVKESNRKQVTLTLAHLALCKSIAPPPSVDTQHGWADQIWTVFDGQLGRDTDMLRVLMCGTCRRKQYLFVGDPVENSVDVCYLEKLLWDGVWRRHTVQQHDLMKNVGQEPLFLDTHTHTLWIILWWKLTSRSVRFWNRSVFYWTVTRPVAKCFNDRKCKWNDVGVNRPHTRYASSTFYYQQKQQC